MAVIRKWGDSLAVTIPPQEIKQRNLKEGEEIDIIIYRRIDSSLFGIVPEKYRGKISGQKAKEMLREEW